MNTLIHPSTITGIIRAASSKSGMQRACAAALLSMNKDTTILNPGKSNDDLAALDIIQKLGASIKSQTDEKIVIHSEGVHPVSDEINCGESGLSIRMFTPIAALSDKQITIAGKGSLLSRPMDFFDEIFPQLDIQIISNKGKLPLIIQGPLKPQSITIDGSLSSQFLTGLLMAYGAVAENKCIEVKSLKSKPYIDLTLSIMNQFGVEVENYNYEKFRFNTANPSYKKTTYTVEGDWSGAAFLLVAGAIAGEIVVKGLDVFSTQADKAIMQALMLAKAPLSIEEKQITVGPAKLQAFHFNATDCPDLFPPLVALAAYCQGKSVIEGASRLTHKESNRALTLQSEFAKLGIPITLQDDMMIVEGGGGVVNGGMVHSHHDHRIAMACAVAGLRAKSEILVEASEAINKSYPDFFEHLKFLGAAVDMDVKMHSI